jgi:hypothetical protein
MRTHITRPSDVFARMLRKRVALDTALDTAMRRVALEYHSRKRVALDTAMILL